VANFGKAGGDINDETMVGIVGGYGAVGRCTARLLRMWGGYRLRIGGRDLASARRFAAEVLDDTCDVLTVDVADPGSVRRFCTDCDVVVNCAGPSHVVLDRVARVALSAGAHYVDPGGDEPVHERLTRTGALPPGRTAVLSAGMMPGLTSLLPRWLAMKAFQRVTDLTAYVSSRDRFTPAAAGDYLLSLDNAYGEPRAAWRRRRKVSGALRPLTGVDVPFFTDPVNAYPYFTAEAERLALALNLETVDWYNVFDGGALMFATVGRLQDAVANGADLSAAATDLARQAQLDMFGRKPCQRFVFQLDGEFDAKPIRRMAVLTAADAYELTGLVTAFVVAALAGNAIGPGLHFAADVLAPRVVDEMSRSPIITGLHVADVPVDAEASFEEGVL
jgi:hypothetical protein